MPHVNSSGGEDLASTDEVKVYKDEGEEEKKSSENLSEDKLGLVTESEEDKLNSRNDTGDVSGQSDGKSEAGTDSGGHIPGYVVTPLYPNGATVGSLGYFPVYPPHASFPHAAAAAEHFTGSKLPGHPGLATHMMMYNNDSFSSPPPAHMGISPVSIDPKTGALRLPRPPMYPLPPHPTQYPHSLYSPESFSQVQWQGHSSYPVSSAGYRYPPIVTNSAALRFSHPGLIPPPHGVHPGLPHGSPLSGPKPGQTDSLHLQHDIHRHEMDNCRMDGPLPHERSPKSKADKAHHIKKPLNAFMLFMKEQRAKVVAECTLKESAAINQILGRKWHALDRSEQAKYYDMAKKEKELHMQLYPGWSARDNYAQHSKRRKRKKTMEGENDNNECTNPKKCRARFGVDKQTQWCKPCRRKKKCIRFLTEDDDDDDDDDEEADGDGGDEGSDTSANDDATAFAGGGVGGSGGLAAPTSKPPSTTTVTKADSTQNTAADLSSSPLSSPDTLLNPSLLSPLSINENSPLIYLPSHDSPDMLPSSTSTNALKYAS